MLQHFRISEAPTPPKQLFSEERMKRFSTIATRYLTSNQVTKSAIEVSLLASESPPLETEGARVMPGLLASH